MKRAALVLLACLGAVAIGPAPSRAAHVCGLPDAQPLWIEYAEGSVPASVRAVFSRPGVVLATSGQRLPQEFRARGANTVYWHMHLARTVGTPSAPADAATIQPAADALFDRATASSACPTPLIALNELAGSHLPTPWSPTNAQYRANVLGLLQRLAERGARPFLLVHGNPNTAGGAATWWQGVAQVADIVYETHYNAANIHALGPVLGDRRMRLGMRGVVATFTKIGIPRARLGFLLGFQVALGKGGREGLQPREEWLRVVKWEALSARQIAADEGISTIWSWGWGTFGPQSDDPDKPAAACVYVWTRDPRLCDGPAAAGPAFNTSRTEGQIVLKRGVECSFAGGEVKIAALRELAAITGDRQLALDALFARSVLSTRVAVGAREIDLVEKQVVARVFRGRWQAYRKALARRHASAAIARGVIGDELRRRKIGAMLTAAGSPQTVLAWTVGEVSPVVDTAICLRDRLPGSGDFPKTNQREVGVVPLPAYLPFLFDDRTPPAPPAQLTATAGSGSVALDWADSPEVDLVGYNVYRSTTPGGPYAKLNTTPLSKSAFVDTSPVEGSTYYYVVTAVDTSNNESLSSGEVAAAPTAASP